MRYRNIKTGAVVNSVSELVSENYVLMDEDKSPAEIPVKKTAEKPVEKTAKVAATRKKK